MPQGRNALYSLMDGDAFWPPVVVPFGLDPFGWHGERESYRELCDYALDNCTLLPKVYPFEGQLAIGDGDICIREFEEKLEDSSVIKRFTLSGNANRELSMEEIRTPGDSSWKNRKRWIESDEDLDFFLGLESLAPITPVISAVQAKEKQVGSHGIPYIETPDPFYTACEMMATDEFFIKARLETDKIETLVHSIGERMLVSIETLCRETGCPFILRLIGAEMAAPPFMSRDDFMRFDGWFYKKVIEITNRYNVPASFHSHGAVSGVLNDVWDMGFAFMEPFEPAPNGDVSIAEALEITNGRGVVFGGVDDVVINSGNRNELESMVTRCLDDARDTGKPFILSQSSTPFSDPLTDAAKENYLLFMQIGTHG